MVYIRVRQSEHLIILHVSQHVVEHVWRSTIVDIAVAVPDHCVWCINLSLKYANVEMSHAEIMLNIQLSINFLVSLLKKNWQNIKVLYVKSTMGPPMQIFY